MPLSPSLPEPRRGAAHHRRVHRPLQQRVAPRAPRPPDAGRSAYRAGGGVTHETRSHSGIRIADRRGGRYAGTPSRLQETGCGTSIVYELTVHWGPLSGVKALSRVTSCWGVT